MISVPSVVGCISNNFERNNVLNENGAFNVIRSQTQVLEIQQLGNTSTLISFFNYLLISSCTFM